MYSVLVVVVKNLHIGLWFVIGFGSCFLWDKGVELHQKGIDLHQAVVDKTALSASLTRCLVTNRKWEDLVQKWGAEQGKCDATLDFNKAMDVLDRETKLEAKKAGVR